MGPTRGPVFVGALVLAVSTACVSGGAEVNEPVPTLFDDDPSTVPDTVEETTSSTAATSTVPVADRLPSLPDDVPGAVRSDEGAVLPITGTDGDVWFVLGPCGENRVEPAATAALTGPQHVVLDPGGVGADGEVTLAIAERAAALLASDGVAVLLTRSTAVEMGAATRGAVPGAVGAAAFVSIVVGDGDGASTEARPSVFHRADDADSRRLAGLVHHEITSAFAGRDAAYLVADEPGVRPLLNQRGEDYFRVLRASAGVPSARVELPALAENATTLLTEEEGRELQSRALADAVVRYLVTNEEGDGFIDPVEAVRIAPTSNTPGGC
jgi:N-acetylmuramoyl-L-alanine amidase